RAAFAGQNTERQEATWSNPATISVSSFGSPGNSGRPKPEVYGRPRSKLRGSTMPKIDFLRLFSEAATDVTGKSFANIAVTTDIANIGLDSVASLELVGYIEENLGIHIADEDLARVQTVGDLEDIVRHLTDGDNAPAL